MGLDGQQHRPVDLVRQIGRRDRTQPGGELLDRTLDPQPVRVDCADDGRIGVTHQHLVAVTDQAGRDRAADRTAAKNDISHGVNVTTQ